MNTITRWVCDNPRRLLACTLIAALAAVVTAGAVITRTGPAPTTATAPAPAPTRGVVITEDLAVETARTYLNTRLVYRADQTPATWLSEVAALAVPENRADLEMVDPTQYGHASVVYGSPTVRYLEPDSAMVAVPVVGGNIDLVTLQVRGDRLLVFTAQSDVGD